MSIIQLNNKSKKSSKDIIFTVLRQISYTNLFKKYTSGKYSFIKISINHLIFNEDCQIVARFKDFLIYDDNTEFIRRFYPKKETLPRLKKILTFYETYSKIFPNYLVLKENKYLYRNIRKKQKMINAINEIKKEEKENKKKLGIKQDKNLNNKKNELFTKKVKDEIKIFQKNLSEKIYKNSFDTDNKNDDDTLLINSNSISISILNWKQFEQNNYDKLKNKNDINIDSFITNKNDESITKMLNILNDNKIYIKDLPNIFDENKKVFGNKNTKKRNIYINKKNNYNQKQINKYSKNDIYKCARTSSNATTSSSIMSKYINKKSINSSKNKIKEEKKNNLKKDIKNEVKKENIMAKKITNNNINKNGINNLYQPLSPQIPFAKYKKHFYCTNNNFKKLNNLKTPINKSKSKKVNKIFPITEKKDLNKFSNNTEKIRYIKIKQISQDLNNKNDYLNKVYTLTNNNAKKFLTENNPNLITGDMIEKDKYLDKNKVHVNLRDIIKSNKKKELFHTAKKQKKSGGLLLSLSKNNINSNNDVKDKKFTENKSNKNINTLANLNCNKYNCNLDRNRNYDFTPKQTSEGIIDKKITKYLTKEDKSKTKSIFGKEKKELSKIREAKSNKKINNLKKKAKIFNIRKNNITNNYNDKIIQNYYSEKFHSHGNIKKSNIKHLTPLKGRKINNSKNNDSKNKTIKIDNKRIKTLSNEQRPYKYKTFLKDKIRNESNNNSNKNFILLHRIHSTKNNMNKIDNYFEKEKLIKTPNMKNKSTNFFQKCRTITTRKSQNPKFIKEKSNDKKVSSYTIKVNKAFVNKKKNLVLFREKSTKKERNSKINSTFKSSI